jgi:23S rRNA (cytosine1962-C5)-methyltransferase
VDDPRYCRLVNDDGDGLPGLVVDRFDQHLALQTSTRAMDARVEEIARALVEVMGAGSIILRNDGPRREELGLPLKRSHVLHGAPPRWTRLLELGARFTVDLHQGMGTGFFYDQREIRRLMGKIARNARVLDPCCFIGGLLVHAGLHGAKQILAFDVDPDAVDLARENAEANGLFARCAIEEADAFEALKDLKEGSFDLVLLDSPDLPRVGAVEAFLELLRLCIRATRRGGRLVVAGYSPPLGPQHLDELVAVACEEEDRVGFVLARPSLPPDFPVVVGSPSAVHLAALALEVT